jgi:hypothetical protein
LILSYAYQTSKTTSISFFGGPEHTHLNETIPPQTVGGPPTYVHESQWDWSAGFSVSKMTNSTTFSLGATHAVSGGGGLLAAVNGTSGWLDISRRLPGNWMGNMRLSYGESRALSFGGLQSGSFTFGMGDISLSHKLGERLSFSVRYNRTQQQGSVPVIGGGLYYADFDRDLVTIGIGWQIGKVHLGH